MTAVRLIPAAQVLSESVKPGVAQVPEPARPAVPKPAAGRSETVSGSVVPVWQNGVEVTVLAPDYQRIAEATGLEPVLAKIEGVRAEAKRLAVRGWLEEKRSGAFSVAASPGGS